VANPVLLSLGVSEPIQAQVQSGGTSVWLVLAPVVSALVAAGLTWLGSWKLESRRIAREEDAEARREVQRTADREAEVRQAARMVWTELVTATTALDAIVESGRIPTDAAPFRQLLTNEHWLTYGPTLALAETYTWQPIAAAYAGMSGLALLLLPKEMQGLKLDKHPEVRKPLERQLREMEKTYEHVRKLTGWDGEQVLADEEPQSAT